MAHRKPNDLLPVTPLHFQLLLALADGTSAGLTLDLVPGRVWLDYQVGATLIPGHRGASVAIDEPFVVTHTLQLAVVF